MRITINAEDDDSAVAGMKMAMNFIREKKEDGDRTSDSWGYWLPGYRGCVTRKKNGNISVTCNNEKDKAA